MKIKWTMGIGISNARQSGEFEIDDEELEGKTPNEIDELISEIVWEDAIQYVDTGWEIIEE